MTDKKLYCPKGHVIHNLISDEFLNHKELGKDRIPISFKKGFCVKCMLPYWEWQCTNTPPIVVSAPDGRPTIAKAETVEYCECKIPCPYSSPKDYCQNCHKAIKLQEEKPACNCLDKVIKAVEYLNKEMRYILDMQPENSLIFFSLSEKLKELRDE